MLIQQQSPMKIGFPPVFINLIISVFNPIAAMAIIMNILLSSLRGVNTDAGAPKCMATVVITDASMK